MRRITLSFDNGPTEGVTGEVLDILAREGITATFFLVGKQLEGRAERRLAERARDEGHRIGNHTYSHTTPLGLLDGPTSVDEIVRTQKRLGDLGDERLFRPFGDEGRIGSHLLSRDAFAHLAAAGFTCVIWNVVPRDWDDVDGWVDTALSMCAEQDWPLVVLHDVPTGGMRHLSRFLEAIRRDFDPVREFPPDCVPILGGVPQTGVERYVAGMEGLAATA
jgi:peptidoglycan/xylan/chitin deacetylase (PgdA/CDA1 family)